MEGSSETDLGLDDTSSTEPAACSPSSEQGEHFLRCTAMAVHVSESYYYK